MKKITRVLSDTWVPGYLPGTRVTGIETGTRLPGYPFRALVLVEYAQTVRLWKHRWITDRSKRKISSGIFKCFVRSSSYVVDCTFWANGSSLWSFWISAQHKKIAEFDQNDLMKCCTDLNIALIDASGSDIDPKDLCSELQIFSNICLLYTSPSPRD